MLHKKISRFFAASLFAALLVLTACTPEAPQESEPKLEDVHPLKASDGIIGTWVNEDPGVYGEKYDIGVSYYNNYSRSDSNWQYHADQWFLYYSTKHPYLYKISETSGILYAQFDDEEHIGASASVGQWYAFYYKNLSSDSVEICQAAKAGGKLACDTLEKAVSEFTIENGYYGIFSSCEKKSNSDPETLNIVALDKLKCMSKLIFTESEVELQMMKSSSWETYYGFKFAPSRNKSKETGNVVLYLYNASESSYTGDLMYLKVINKGDNNDGVVYCYMYDDEEEDNDSILEFMYPDNMPVLTSEQITKLKNAYN